MPYTTPVYDRTQADINAGNAKAFLNVADWTRIYDNVGIVNGLFTSEIGYTLAFTTISTPTTATVPKKTDWLNALTANIEQMRAWADTYLSAYISDPLFVEIKDDWGDGHAATAPNYTHVNSWEYVLDVLYDLLSTWTPPALSGNLDLFAGGSLELFGGGNLELF